VADQYLVDPLVIAQKAAEQIDVRVLENEFLNIKREMYYDGNILKDPTLFYRTRYRTTLNHFGNRLSRLEKSLLYLEPRVDACTLRWKTQTALDALASDEAYEHWQLCLRASKDICIREITSYDPTAMFQSKHAESRSNAHTCGP
jgi:hypothetical protein